jgi:hypothetical protein
VAYADSNGYILCGKLSGQTQYEPVLIKTNLYGDTVWTKILHGINAENQHDMVKTNDGGFVLMNEIYNINTQNDIYLTKTDGLGNVVWNNTIIHQSSDVGYRLKQTIDNGYIIAGKILSFHDNAYIVKTNSDGSLTWVRNYGREDKSDYACDVIETFDTNYIFVGYGEGYGVNHYQVYLVKLKPNGDTVWTKNIGDSFNNFGYCIKETIDKNYIIIGEKSTINTNPDVYAIKTDTNGNVLWDKTYDFSPSNYGRRILVLENGYLIAGDIYRNAFNILLIRINNCGDTLWTKIIQSTCSGYLVSIDKCTDNGFLITRWTGDLTLMKTDSLGCIKPSVLSITGEQNVSLNDTITYHNNSVRGSLYYWFSGSGNIVSGQGLDYITIYWNQIGMDTLYSVSYNDCGSDTLSYIINIDSCVGPKISSIYGDFYPEFYSASVYYVNRIEGKIPINYNWTINFGTIINGQGTNTITVDWYNEGTDDMVVIATNLCGSDTSFANVYLVIHGIKDTIDVNTLDVAVFPVPANNILYLNFPLDFNNYKVELFDIYGKQKYYNSMLPGLNEINLSNLNNS